MRKNCPMSTEARSGMSMLLWKRHALSDPLGLEQTDHDDRRQDADLLNWTARLYINRFHSPVSGLSLSKSQVIGMSTFLPDELISLLLTCRRYTTFIGAVLFADVSGFTPLCEKYAKFGPTGAYRLTATLNQYIGSMVDLIYNFGGDVIKFSGDAFLGVWHVRVKDFLYEKIDAAISCALHIQYSLGNFVTDVGLYLRVKLAISAGNLVFAVVGKERSGSYVAYGLPILEVKKAESLCRSGDTVVAPSAWFSLSPRNYSWQPLADGYVKIKQILYDPKSPKQRIFQFDPNFIMKIHKRNKMLKSISSKTDPSATILDFEENFRKIIFEERLLKSPECLKPFVIPPVMAQIEANQSLDYTVEMRQVTIMFINVIPNKTSCRDIVILVDETYRSILKSIQSRLGLINKVCLFDKDIMFLCIFGLKGYKDKDEATRTLRAAYEILQNVSEFSGVKSISIGVTVGTTYCGVVGHPLRKEYTVIGAPVNKAARLGCTFKGVVTCDATVAFNSRLPPAFFEKMEPKCLKGIGTVSNIYRYMDLGVSALTAPPILGRYNAIKLMADMLWEESAYRALVIVGEPRVGRTRLLLELSDLAAAADWVPVLTPLHAKVGVHVCLLHKIIAYVLGNTIKERMAAIVRLLSGEEDIEELYLLNSHLDVRFPVPPAEYSSQVGLKACNVLYQKTLKKIFDKHVLLIDDADALDAESWSVLVDLIKVANVLVAVSLPCISDSSEAQLGRYVRHPLVLVVKLGNLPYKYIAPLVCQMLGVDAVPHKLIRALYKISKGNPGWVQAFLLSYIDTGAFVVTSEFASKLSKRSFYVPDQISRIAKTSLSINDDSSSFSEEKLFVCKLMKKDLGADGIPPTFDDVIMATFDNLTVFEQLFLKCGAILGKEFQRSELEAVMNYPSSLTLALAVKNLFEIDVLGCATKLYEEKGSVETASSPFGVKQPIQCRCPDSHRGSKNQVVSDMGGLNLEVRREEAVDIRRRAVLGVPVNTQTPAPSDTAASHRWHSPTLARRQRSQDTFFPSTSISFGFGRQEVTKTDLLKNLSLEIPHVVKCTCNQLLNEMYEKLLYHSHSADAKVEKLKILVEFGIHHVKYSNFPVAYNYLKSALEVYEEIVQNLATSEKRDIDGKKIKIKSVSVREILFEKEKALCYFGKCCTHLGNFRRATISLKEVADVSCLTKLEVLFKKGLLKVKFFPEKYKDKIKSFIHLKSYANTCLAHAHLMQFEYAEAEYAVKKAIKYGKIVSILQCMASAYSTYIDINLLRGHYDDSKRGENEALKLLLPLYEEKDIWSVTHIGKVLVAVFKGRLYRGELSEAIDIAKAALKTAYTFRATNVITFLFPLFLRCLAYQKKFMDIVEVLCGLESNSRQFSSFEKCTIRRLYDRLNLLLLTEIGFCMEKPLQLIARLQAQYSGAIQPKKEFAKAQIWRIEPHDGMDLLYENIPNTIIFLEAQIQWMVYKINETNEINAEKVAVFDQRLKKIEWICKKRRLFMFPRVLHLKAYRNVICFNYEDAKRQIPGLLELKKALTIAREHGNVHQMAWIHYTLDEWYMKTDSLTAELQHSDAVFATVNFPNDKELYQDQADEVLYHFPLPNIVIDKLKECIKANQDVLLTTGLFRTEDVYQ